MIGLKTYLSTLSPLLGQSEEILYERQRALVREGLLESVSGRGPGSGVRADEKALAVFLVSLLAHDILAHAETVWAFCGMRSPPVNVQSRGKKLSWKRLEPFWGTSRLPRKPPGSCLSVPVPAPHAFSLSAKTTEP